MAGRTLHVRCTTWDQVVVFTTRKLRKGRMLSMKVPFAATVGMAFAARPCVAADAAAGKAVFNRCRACHTLEAGGRNGAGPNLHALFGRKAGTVERFAFSAAMKESGIVWDEAALAQYLRDPKQFIPGTRMAFPGIESGKAVADLLAYLQEATR